MVYYVFPKLTIKYRFEHLSFSTSLGKTAMHDSRSNDMSSANAQNQRVRIRGHFSTTLVTPSEYPAPFSRSVSPHASSSFFFFFFRFFSCGGGGGRNIERPNATVAARTNGGGRVRDVCCVLRSARLSTDAASQPHTYSCRTGRGVR